MNAHTRSFARSRQQQAGFSLIEMLAAVAIIGVITFLAIPNLIRMRSDSERNLAIARAESINVAIASFIQVRGRTQAVLDWNGAGTNAASHQLKYALVDDYLAYAEGTLVDYMPKNFTIEFGATITPLTKVVLKQSGTRIYY